MKMRLKRGLSLILIQFLIGIPLLAQDNLSVTLFGSSTFPVGEFGEKIGENPRITRRFGFDFGEHVGLASTGYSFGVELKQPVLTKNLSWVISSRILLNTVDNSEITSFYQNEVQDSADISFKNGRWLNIPVLTGFSYRHSILDGVNLYGIVKGGINITRQPYRNAYVNGELVEETSFRFTPDFGLELGFGIELLRKYDIGFRYFNLSNPRYEGTRKLNESFFPTIPKREMNVDGDERPISLFLILFGYRL
jgi:hypothetical protein